MNVTLIANTPEPQRLIEACARISYNSKNDPFDPEVNSKFIRKLIENGHESPLEHASATFLIEGISRTCSHQIVRHRLASFTQRSGRYTDPIDDMYLNPGDHNMHVDNDFVIPEPLKKRCSGSDELWMRELVGGCRQLYKRLVASGVPKEDARFVLPQGEKTSLYMTANFREWRHFLQLRLDRHAQWEIRGVAKEVLGILFHIASDCFHDFVSDELERNIVEKGDSNE